MGQAEQAVAERTREVGNDTDQQSSGGPIALHPANPASVAMPVANSTAFLGALLSAASNPATNMDNMERMYAMHKEMVTEEAKAAFNVALARAQSEIQPIATNAYNNQTKSRYAKLDMVCSHITPIFSKNGLSISFNNGVAATPGWIRIIGLLSHSQGHTREYFIDLPQDGAGMRGRENKTGVQAIGSTNAYGRRYLQFMMANLSTLDDRDGNGANRQTGQDEDEEPGMSEQQYADYTAAIEASADADSLGKLWKAIVATTNKLHDIDAYNHFKPLVEAKGNSLKKGKK